MLVDAVDNYMLLLFFAMMRNVGSSNAELLLVQGDALRWSADTLARYSDVAAKGCLIGLDPKL